MMVLATFFAPRDGAEVGVAERFADAAVNLLDFVGILYALRSMTGCPTEARVPVVAISALPMHARPGMVQHVAPG